MSISPIIYRIRNDPYRNFVWRRQTLQRKKRKIIVDLLHDYSSSATLHGISYIGAKDKTLPEKIWWIIMFTMSICMCGYLINRTWIKWKDNPVMLSFAKEPVDISKIPFPAVTVCPVNKIVQSKYNYTKIFHNRNNLTQDEYKKFWDISMICSLELYTSLVDSLNCSINFTDNDAVKNIYKVAPTKENTIMGSTWQLKNDKGNFSEIMTESGICFTFNILNQEDMFTKEQNPDAKIIRHKIKNTGWSLENGYASSFNILNDYPRRAVQDGPVAGLTFVLQSLVYDNDYLCRIPVAGYRITLNNPAEMPRTIEEYYLIPPNKKITMMVKPELIGSSKKFRSLSLEARKCYYSNEKHLRFFKTYTQHNCISECVANMTLNYCGCLPAHMPRPRNTTVCGFMRRSCITSIKDKTLEFKMIEEGLDVPDEEKNTIEYKVYKNCACLPTCHTLHYSADTTNSELRIRETVLALKRSTNLPAKLMIDAVAKGQLSYSHVDIFFRESEFYALRRSELYGQTDFLANCGGLLGLFLGFSLLSLIEIIYFLTLRLWCKLKNR